MSRAFFTDVADALRGFLPRELRAFSSYTGAHNVKVWYGADSHEHYEVQLISRSALKAGKKAGTGPALEIGFHSEHPSADDNERAIERVHEAIKTLGRPAEAGRFLGRQSSWMRVSEIWEGDTITAPEAAIEAAERLANYIRAIEKLRATVDGRSPRASRPTGRRR